MQLRRCEVSLVTWMYDNECYTIVSPRHLWPWVTKIFGAGVGGCRLRAIRKRKLQPPLGWHLKCWSPAAPRFSTSRVQQPTEVLS